MSEQEPTVEQKTGPPSGPDMNFEHNGSKVEVYNLQKILSEQSGRIYDRSDFGGVIQRITLDEEKIALDQETGMALSLTIGLDPFRETPTTYDPIENAIDLGSDKYFDTKPVGGFPGYKDSKYIITKDGLRIVLWYDKINNRVLLSNNLSLENTRTKEKTIESRPHPLNSFDGDKQLESFTRVAVSLIDKIASKRLNRTYKIGERLDNIPPPVKKLGGTAMKQAKDKALPSQPQGKGKPLEQFEDVLSAVDEKVTLSDIGGLEDIKQELQDIALSFAKPEIMEKWGAKRPQGILLYGSPGTGKTMLVEALANEINADLIRVQSSDIYIKWLGDSEAKIKEMFSAFRKLEKPTVVLFDEFDAIVGITEEPTPGGADNARNSVAGIFKQEMNTLAKDNPNILIVATTNQTDKIDPSLIRTGRFDHRLYVPMPDVHGRDQIITGIMSKLMLSRESEDFKIFAEDINAQQLTDQTDGMSGADIAEIFRRISLAKAMQEARTGNSAPISQAEMVGVIQEFKSESFA